MTTKRAAIYCRISRDTEGTELGVRRQEEDCRRLVEREGFDLVGVWVDNDISASKFKRKARPQYDALMAAVRAGDVDVIVAYSNSRLTRRPVELEAIIQLHETTGVQIKTVVSGAADLSTADGRQYARIQAGIDAGEVERQSERIRRAHLQRAQRGARNHGGRPFGWQDDKVTLHPVEAAMVRKAATDLLDGVPLRRIAAEWNAAGVMSSRGNPWTHTELRRLLQRPRMVGHRVHRGEVVKGLDGLPVAGEWEPLLEADQWHRLQAMFATDGRTGRRGARKYLLSGLVRCGLCGARMHGSKTKTGHVYTCGREGADHTNTIEGTRTDAAVLATARARLEAEQFEPVVAAPASDPTAERLADIAQQVSELMAAYRAKHLSAGVVFPMVASLEAEQADLEAEQARAAAAVPVAPASVSAADLVSLDEDRQRAVLAVLWEAIPVQPAGRRGERWTVDRLDLTGWR